MSLFEIDLNYDFKILGCQVFLTKEQLFHFYKINKLHSSFSPKIEEILDYLNDDYSVNGSIILLDQYYDEKESNLYSIRYSNESINDFFLKDIYTNGNSYHKITSKILYPEWLLFYIAMNKFEALQFFKNNFIKHIELFKYIAQIRYKKYIQYQIKNYVNDLKKLDETKNELNNSFMKYLKDSEKKEEELLEFLYFLTEFRREAKTIEKYKLMWNIEIYIREILRLFADKKVILEDIYKKIGGGNRYSELHETYLLNSLYIKESKAFFAGSTRQERIKNIFNNSLNNNLLEDIFSNKRYEDIFLFYMEIIKRLNADKLSEIAMSGMIKGLILGIEEILKESTLCSKDERNGLFCYLTKLTGNISNLKKLRNKITLKDSKELQLCKLENIILGVEESLEKYLMIFYHSRNYVAHNNIALDKFFWGEDGNRTIINGALDSIMIILYKIEIMKNDKVYK